MQKRTNCAGASYSLLPSAVGLSYGTDKAGKDEVTSKERETAWSHVSKETGPAMNCPCQNALQRRVGVTMTILHMGKLRHRETK